MLLHARTEEVEQYGFDLFFLAWTLEEPPLPHNLRAVENREWVYQRPYTTLEIQVRDFVCVVRNCREPVPVHKSSSSSLSSLSSFQS